MAGKVAYHEAMAQRRANARSVWSPKTKDDDRKGFAVERIHASLADVSAPVPFRFHRDQSFFCVGSCFAREIEDAITAEGGRSETRERSLELISSRPDLFQPAAHARGRPNAFLNRYNSASMALLLQDICEEALGDRLLFGREDQKIDFHYTRFIQPLPLSRAMERRALLRQMYAEAMAASDVFVFTLGLCEAFRDQDDGTYLNITPDPKAAAGRNLEFRFLSLEENLQCLRDAVRNLRVLRPEAQIVLTVSPVPLDMTFTGMDIVAANSLAKATLLCAAHTMAAEDPQCFYFPSYEMVTASSQADAWQWDKKHVSGAMVSHVMKLFLSRHMS